MNKRGQYYIVAVIIFLGIFLSLMSVLNISKRETSTNFGEMSKEIKIESSKVLEYSSNMEDDKIDDFTKKYAEYAEEEANIYFITGDLSTTQEVYNYTNGVKQNIVFSLNGNILNTEIKGEPYSFEFKKGKNFYFVITKKSGDEEYLLRG